MEQAFLHHKTTPAFPPLLAFTCLYNCEHEETSGGILAMKQPRKMPVHQPC